MLSLLLAAVLAAPQIEVRTLSGETADGTLAVLSPKSITLQTRSGDRSFAIKDLLSASAAKSFETPIRLPVLVELIDGTRIPAQNVQSTDGAVTLKLDGGRTLQVAMKQLRWIRTFDSAEPNAKFDVSWADLTSGDAAGDVLVVRNKDNLVATDGVVGDISSESVAFTLDENKLVVKRTKVEGVIFARAAHEELPETVCIVVDSQGARWHARTFELQGDKFKLTTAAGVSFELPISSLSQLDFSQGKLVYLSDLNAESFDYQPYFGLAKPLDTLTGYYRLRRDVGLEKQPLELDGKVYRKGLAMHSRSRVVYRLPGKFRTFTATVGIDDAVRELGGDVLLEFSGDGKSLWKGNIRGSEAAQPLELDVTGVKRLEILADYGAGEDVADHLNLCEAKVVK